MKVSYIAHTSVWCLTVGNC